MQMAPRLDFQNIPHFLKPAASLTHNVCKFEIEVQKGAGPRETRLGIENRNITKTIKSESKEAIGRTGVSGYWIRNNRWQITWDSLLFVPGKLPLKLKEIHDSSVVCPACLMRWRKLAARIHDDLILHRRKRKKPPSLFPTWIILPQDENSKDILLFENYIIRLDLNAINVQWRHMKHFC